MATQVHEGAPQLMRPGDAARWIENFNQWFEAQRRPSEFLYEDELSTQYLADEVLKCSPASLRNWLRNKEFFPSRISYGDHPVFKVKDVLRQLECIQNGSLNPLDPEAVEQAAPEPAPVTPLRAVPPIPAVPPKDPDYSNVMIAHAKAKLDARAAYLSTLKQEATDARGRGDLSLAIRLLEDTLEADVRLTVRWEAAR